MTLNMSRGLERLEKRLSERAKRFRQEFERLENPKDAWGLRLTATPVGDEIRIDRVFRQHGLAAEFKEPWHGILYRQGDQDFRSLKGLEYYYTAWSSSWKPRLRAVRGEPDPTLHNNLPYNSYQELHCDGLIELGHVVSGHTDSDEGGAAFFCHLTYPFNCSPTWLFGLIASGGSLLLLRRNMLLKSK